VPVDLAGGHQAVDAHAVLVDRQPDHLRSGGVDRRPGVVERRVLDRDAPRPAGGEPAAREPQPLGVPARHHEVGGRRPAHPHEVGGQLAPQLLAIAAQIASSSWARSGCERSSGAKCSRVALLSGIEVACRRVRRDGTVLGHE
jgi:hypothetical protein